MKKADCGLHDQIFSFVAEGTGEHYHWNITKARDAFTAGELTPVANMYLDIAEADYIHVCLHNGIEEDHLLNITQEQLRIPLLLAEFPPAEATNGEPSHVVIDGNHRLVQTYRLGGRRMAALIFDVADLAPFLVDELMAMDPAKVAIDLTSQQKAKP